MGKKVSLVYENNTVSTVKEMKKKAKQATPMKMTCP
jgi:hypothetical protein